MNLVHVAILSTFALLPSLARAESLEEKKKHNYEQEQIDKSADSTDQRCGTKITGQFDWKGTKLEDFSTNSPSGYCEAAFNALSLVCDDKDGKEAVQKKVKKVLCKFGGKDKRAIKLNGSTLEFTIDWGAANNDDYVKDFLMKKL
jgi:hypothetical protein